MIIETELKLRVDPGHIAVLVDYLNACAQPQPSRHLVNTYFDTPSASLSVARAALRIRQDQQGFEQTLKAGGQSNGGLHQRQEWNWPVSSAELDLTLLHQDDVQRIWPQTIEPDQLKPVFQTNFERHAWLWQREGTLAEVAIDHGYIQTDDNQAPLCELEIELKSGENTQLWSMAQELARQAPLWLSNISKAERGYQQADMPVATSSRTDPDEHADLHEVFVQLMQQAWMEFQNAWEICLWQGDSNASLELWSQWLLLRHLPQWFGKIIKRKTTLGFRQNLDKLQAVITNISGLTSCDRFLNDGSLRQLWLSEVQQYRDDQQLASILLELAAWVYELPNMLPARDEKTEVFRHFLHRNWKEAIQVLDTPKESWQASQWLDLQVQVAHICFLYGIHISHKQREKSLLNDVVQGLLMLSLSKTGSCILSDGQHDIIDQEVPRELYLRWQPLKRGLHSQFY